MRRFLTAFICLSTLAMAQNVIAAAPSFAEQGLEVVDCPLGLSPIGAETVGPADRPASELPEPGTMMLLVAGFSGLTAVGARDQERPAAPTK